VASFKGKQVHPIKMTLGGLPGQIKDLPNSWIPIAWMPILHGMIHIETVLQIAHSFIRSLSKVSLASFENTAVSQLLICFDARHETVSTTTR
jgi:hypothetical protein